ncbi:MAG: biotin--[acetyl-CoA-carboxylase] ligase [Gammaproteobacteria bacterium]|nr:biotin--[acetyl-CoA-carboxylase] ligase [Gammaproteobacteria bacterium]
MPVAAQQPEPLVRNKILSQMDQRARNSIHDLAVYRELASTSDHLRQQEFQVDRANVCLAEAQTAGRGRRGREWLSAPNRNLMLSISWAFETWPKTLTGLGLAVALVVVERLRSSLAVEAQIKWPNDILVNDAKLAGILVDVAGQHGQQCDVVIGLGLNIHQPDWEQHATEYAWQDLYSLGVHPQRNLLAAQLIGDCVIMLQEFAVSGFAPMARRWNELSSYQGRTVKISSPNIQVGTLSGVMRGVDEFGALLVEDDQSICHRFVETDISVRVQQ